MQSTSSEGITEAGEGTQHNGQLESAVDELKDRLQSLNERVTEFIKERPAASLLGAAAVGYVLARIARRRS
jgi:ElaB/YqjD/DUF883 family membrane-anchored ribosome-binding protein